MLQQWLCFVFFTAFGQTSSLDKKKQNKQQQPIWTRSLEVTGAQNKQLGSSVVHVLNDLAQTCLFLDTCCLVWTPQ